MALYTGDPTVGGPTTSGNITFGESKKSSSSSSSSSKKSTKTKTPKSKKTSSVKIKIEPRTVWKYYNPKSGKWETRKGDKPKVNNTHQAGSIQQIGTAYKIYYSDPNVDDGNEHISSSIESVMSRYPDYDWESAGVDVANLANYEMPDGDTKYMVAANNSNLKAVATDERYQGLFGTNVTPQVSTGRTYEQYAGTSGTTNTASVDDIIAGLPDIVTINGNNYGKNSPVIRRALENPESVADGENFANQVRQQSSATTIANPTPATTTTGDYEVPYDGKTRTGTLADGTQVVETYQNGQWVVTKKTTPATTDPHTGTPGTSGANGTSGTSGNAAALEAAYKIIDDAVTKGDLTAQQGIDYKAIIANWDTSKLIDVKNVLDEYNKYRSTIIDPYWKSQSDFEVATLQEAVKQQQINREMELEQERAVSGENIRQAKAGLEKSGMTFTGQGIEQLGNESAYAQDRSAAIPSQTPYNGAFYEGLVNQANRLMSSSNAARYQQNLQSLGSQGEQSLGSKGIAGLIPGYKPLGDIEGSMHAQKVGEQAATFQDILNKYNKLNTLNNPLITY